jgi:hypothetical protein
MIIYKNIGLDNIRKKKKKEKEKKINTFGDVCWFFSIIILCLFNSMLLYTYYIISLRMLIHIVNYCTGIREKTS